MNANTATHRRRHWIRPGATPPVHVITSVGAPGTDTNPDSGQGPAAPLNPHRTRMRRYLLSMSIRTVCFVGALLTHGWVQVAMIAAAIIVPYFAVLLANSDTRTRGISTVVRP